MEIRIEYSETPEKSWPCAMRLWASEKKKNLFRYDDWDYYREPLVSIAATKKMIQKIRERVLAKIQKEQEKYAAADYRQGALSRASRIVQEKVA